MFGEHISVYDIQRAVEDKATVPIYYESRLAKLELNEAERPKIDPAFDEVTEGEETERKEKLKSKWAQLEAVVGEASDNLSIVLCLAETPEEEERAEQIARANAKPNLMIGSSGV